MLDKKIYSQGVDGKEKLLTDTDYKRISSFMYDRSGIFLDESKKVLIESRLIKRLRINQFADFAGYLDAVFNHQIPDELEVLVNLLTTNETYFFREPHHFENLTQIILERKGHEPFRVWSAASSSGEETYSLGMLLDDKCGPGNWSLMGSDLSSKVLAQAEIGHYKMDRIDGIPDNYLKRYCLKGFGPQEGNMLIDSSLRQKIKFMQINLKENLPDIGIFDVVFLRNIIIYFDRETKSEIVSRVLSKLKVGGYLFIGHSETLNGICPNVKSVFHTVYQKYE